MKNMYARMILIHLLHCGPVGDANNLLIFVDPVLVLQGLRLYARCPPLLNIEQGVQGIKVLTF